MQFDVQSVIRRIEIRLAEIGMTKQEFYEKSGISSGSFSQWNTGKHAPSIKKVQRAAGVIGVTTEYLLYGVDPMPDFVVKLPIMDTIDKINYYLAKNKKAGADLCEFLGISSGVYSQWNTRRTKPRKSKLPAIAEYLGVSVSDLLPDEEPSAGIKKDPIPKDEVEGSAKQKLLNALDGLSDSQIEKLIGIIEEAKKLL